MKRRWILYTEFRFHIRRANNTICTHTSIYIWHYIIMRECNDCRRRIYVNSTLFQPVIFYHFCKIYGILVDNDFRRNKRNRGTHWFKRKPTEPSKKLICNSYDTVFVCTIHLELYHYINMYWAIGYLSLISVAG